MNSLADNIGATQPNRGTTLHSGDTVRVYGAEAIERLYEFETGLDDARMTALRDLFTLDERVASVYVVLKDESLRKNWIRMTLKDMGFPGELLGLVWFLFGSPLCLL